MELISARPDPPPGPYLVAGLGRAGRPAVRRLAALAGPGAVSAWDADERGAGEEARDLGRAGVRVVLGGDGVELLTGPSSPRCIVKSPGIAPSVPLLTEARRRRIVVIDELELGWRLDGRPTVAVTGTNGKSTVAALAVALLRQTGARPVLAGNVFPGPPLTAVSPEEGDIVVCEVSSFQLEGCPAFLPEVAVFTGLSHEHLDRHRTFSRYGAAKRRMFVRGHTAVPMAVVNIDGRFGAELAGEIRRRGGSALRYGVDESADYRLLDCTWTVTGGWLCAETPRGRIELGTRLPGRHNALNALAALALADALHVTREQAVAAIGSAPGIPGRFEAIEGAHPFDVVVDYAHNPDGLRRVLEAGRRIVEERGQDSRLRVVCSAPRIRNGRQRQMMGRVVASLADHAILTNERIPETDSAFELPPDFERAALAHPIGCCEVVPDREQAIECALLAARPGDLVLILGRGNAAGALLNREGRRQLFDDREATRRALDRVAGPALQRA